MFFTKRIATERFHTTAICALMAILPLSAMAEKPFDYYGFDPANYSAAGQDGLNEIFSGRMFYTAFPLSLSKAMSAVDEARADELGYDLTTDEGRFFLDGTVPSPPTRPNASDISLGSTVFERDGAILTNGNCFSCHSGVVNGQVVAGLANMNVMQRLPGAAEAGGPNMFKLMSALENDAEKKVMSSLMKSMGGGIRPNVPEVTNRGDNYGPFAVWAYGAQLADPANKGLVTSNVKTELTSLIEDNMSPPVNAMPWWLMKYKVRDYWYGDGAPTDAAHFSVNFTGPHDSVNDNHESHVASTAKALAFARETQSPIFPGDVNGDLVQKGADLFHGRTEPTDATYFKACFECHGTYTKKSNNLDYSKPGSWDVDYSGSEELKKVRTDSAYNEIVQKYRPISEHINTISDYFAKQERPDLTPKFDHLEGKGYVPPPLVGVWATAPYFHNGSVPTIQAVLNSKLRPEIWSREQSAHAYDLEDVGMIFDPMTRVEYDASAKNAAAAPYKSKASLDQMFIYDTAGYGRGNKGHTFGDSLTTDERTAIIEFLKSLSGPDM